MKKSDNFTDKFLDEPIEKGVILRRDENGVCYTNVQHLVTHHSPTGFEWGYAGSGPADLALNIVELVLQKTGYKGDTEKCWDGECFELSYALHQDFKREFVATASPRPGPTQDRLDWEYIVGWVKDHTPKEDAA